MNKKIINGLFHVVRDDYCLQSYKQKQKDEIEQL